MSYCPDCASKDREIERLSAEIDCGALCGKCLTCWQHSAVTMLERYKQASAENQRLREVLVEAKSAMGWVNGIETETSGQDWSMLREAVKAIDAALSDSTPSDQREEKI